MSAKKLLKKILASPANVRFDDACRLAEAFGFRLVRVSGSHHMFLRDGIPELLNLQNVSGQAKPYQIRQLLKLVERYDLNLGGGT